MIVSSSVRQRRPATVLLVLYGLCFRAEMQHVLLVLQVEREEKTASVSLHAPFACSQLQGTLL